MKEIGALSFFLIAVVPWSVCAAGTPATQPSGSDWPQWAGPDANYTSPEKGLLREWPADGPKVLWRAKIGQGWSCPSIAGDEVYVVSTVWSTKWEQGERETTVCLDANTGKELWTYEYDTGKHYQSANINIGWHWGGPRATPMVTEKYVYSLGLLGHLACLDRKTHKLVWDADLNKAYWPGPYPEWKGVNFSPTVAEGVVLIPFGSDGKNRCVALDAQTGKQKWTYPEDTDLTSIKGCYPGGNTPIVATFGKDRCVVIAGNRDNSSLAHSGFPSFRALRLSDGKPVWEFEWKADKCGDGAATPYFLDNQLVFHTPLSTVYVDVDFKTAPFPAKIASVANIGAGYHGFAASGDALYGFAGGGDAMDLTKWGLSLVCMDRATGKTMWAEKGFKSGVSIIAADGLLFARSFQSLYLIEATPKGFVQKGSVEKLHDVTNARGTDGGWVMPVLSRGKLYVRTPSELICFKVSKE